jgi:glutamate/tyrosine decarboxylase-like PLP-dependent enzyme
MKRKYVPSNAFIDPTGQNKAEVKQLMEAVMNLVLHNSTEASHRSPLPQPVQTFFGSFPEQGLPMPELLKQLKKIMEYAMNPMHPNYIGHMDSIPTLISCLAEFVSTSLNNNMLSLEMSPIFSHMETQVIRSLAQKFGFNEKGGGVLLSGGSLANLQALAIARNHAFPAVLRDGLFGLDGQAVVFASEVSHTSLQKAAMLLGLGTSGIIPVKVNENSQLDVQDLEFRIKEALDKGKKPFAIVATAGTTVTGSIDPIPSISIVAKKFGLWLHVDAAYGGALVFSKKQRHRLNGVEQADSITFNPQKWMYVAKTCAMVLFKNQDILEKDFRISAPYMNDTAFTNLGEISVQGTRHADILKLWLSLQHIGLKGYEELLDETYELIHAFTKEVKNREFLELAVEPETNICCFRGRPQHLQPDQWDQWNFELQQFLLAQNQTFFSLPTYRENRWLRCVLLNPFSSREAIKQIFAKIDEFCGYGRQKPSSNLSDFRV